MQTEKDFNKLYHAYVPKVHRLCLGYASGQEDLAKEWVQETFIKVWKHRKSFKGNSAIGTWIYRIAVNVCLNDLRKYKKRVPLQQVQAFAPIANEEEPPSPPDIAKLYACIEQLTEPNKALILLSLEEVPQQTIAATMNLEHGAVRTRLSRIRKALLKCITHGNQ